MRDINKELMEFINKTPNSYYCVNNIKNKLLEEGFIELYENEIWDNLKEEGKYFVIKNDSSLIAFKMVDILENIGFNIVSAHTDSPSFSIKPNADIYEENYLKLNTNGYGGMLNYTWLDRPLSLAGRVITFKDGFYEKQFINIDKDLLIIPSQAIHLNREANDNISFNHQIDMLPVISLNKDKNLNDIIKTELLNNGNEFDKICDYDLYLYNREKAKYIGVEDEMILAPRIDDLASLFPSLVSFIESKNNKSINVFCAFDNEEIGSMSIQGADSTFLIDTLSRIAEKLSLNLLTMLKNSIVISADNAHATHPNQSSKSDVTNKVYMNKGIVIKHHINYSTNAVTSSVFKGICEKANVPVQDFACKSDLKCGSTLGKISQTHVSVDCVDIGLPQLAMHSINETIGSKDVEYMYKALLQFYNSTIVKEKNIIKII